MTDFTKLEQIKEALYQAYKTAETMTSDDGISIDCKTEHGIRVKIDISVEEANISKS